MLDGRHELRVMALLVLLCVKIGYDGKSVVLEAASARGRLTPWSRIHSS